MAISRRIRFMGLAASGSSLGAMLPLPMGARTGGPLLRAVRHSRSCSDFLWRSNADFEYSFIAWVTLVECQLEYSDALKLTNCSLMVVSTTSQTVPNEPRPISSLIWYWLIFLPVSSIWRLALSVSLMSRGAELGSLNCWRVGLRAARVGVE